MRETVKDRMRLFGGISGLGLVVDIIDGQNKHADTSLVTILGDSMELVEGRQPIAGA